MIIKLRISSSRGVGLIKRFYISHTRAQVPISYVQMYLKPLLPPIYV